MQSFNKLVLVVNASEHTLLHCWRNTCINSLKHEV